LRTKEKKDTHGTHSQQSSSSCSGKHFSTEKHENEASSFLLPGKNTHFPYTRKETGQDSVDTTKSCMPVFNYCLLLMLRPFSREKEQPEFYECLSFLMKISQLMPDVDMTTGKI
jgi:hypothetical protein